MEIYSSFIRLARYILISAEKMIPSLEIRDAAKQKLKVYYQRNQMKISNGIFANKFKLLLLIVIITYALVESLLGYVQIFPQTNNVQINTTTTPAYGQPPTLLYAIYFILVLAIWALYLLWGYGVYLATFGQFCQLAILYVMKALILVPTEYNSHVKISYTLLVSSVLGDFPIGYNRTKMNKCERTASTLILGLGSAVVLIYDVISSYESGKGFQINECILMVVVPIILMAACYILKRCFSNLTTMQQVLIVLISEPISYIILSSMDNNLPVEALLLTTGLIVYIANIISVLLQLSGTSASQPAEV